MTVTHRVATGMESARRRFHKLLIIIAMSVAMPVFADSLSGQEHTTRGISAQAHAYLRFALDIMQEHSINRDHIDWPQFRARVLARADGAVVSADTHPVLREALRELGDGHSFLRGGTWPARTPMTRGARERNPMFSREQRSQMLDGIGYLSVPAFPRGTHAMQQAYAADMQSRIDELSAQGACGWIVDLRGNTGGTFWPMLTGTGPLLGDGVWAFAVHADGRRVPVWYRDGQSGLDESVQLRVFEPVRDGELASMPVALLIGPMTASAGEAVAIVFAGRDATRVFGEPTRGVSTVNRTFPLGDGATMALTVAATADRHGRVRQQAIEPDVAVHAAHAVAESLPALVDQPEVTAALAWLASASQCDRHADAIPAAGARVLH